MKYISIFLFFAIISISSAFTQSKWKDLAVTENTEVYIDTTSIKNIDGQIYARTKTIYTTDSARQAYTGKIKKVFKKNADKKISKWDNFSYNITYGIYDCTNKRFKILQIEDYTSDNNMIVKTKTKESKAMWIFVDTDTVGDYILYYICDEQY